MSNRTEFCDEWEQRALQAGVAPDLVKIGTTMRRTVYEQPTIVTAEEKPRRLSDSIDAMIRFAIEQPERARELWRVIVEAGERGESRRSFRGYDVHELLEFQPGDYPWDRWEQQALAAGVPKRLAALGRSVMREAVQHHWDDDLQVECGWTDDGLAMLRYVLNEPENARQRWEYLMETDGDPCFDL